VAETLADLDALKRRLAAATQADGITFDRELLTEMIRRSNEYERLFGTVEWSTEQLALGRTVGHAPANLGRIEARLNDALFAARARGGPSNA